MFVSSVRTIGRTTRKPKLNIETGSIVFKLPQGVKYNKKKLSFLKIKSSLTFEK